MSKSTKTDKAAPPRKGERIAKVMARAGLASRRGAEAIIAEGRVTINGQRLETPAVTVNPHDEIRVDGKRLPRPEPARLWRYHKPKGLITTNRDEDGRATIFDKLPEHLPRVITVGRLDMNTEGLLLLTNDGDLARHLELPETGWLRRYRVRAFGRVDQETLDALAKGPVIDGIVYGSVVARVERQQGDNVWLIVDLREGKNREVKRVLNSINLDVNRLIRVSYGPFTLDNMMRGEVAEVPRRILSQQVPERFRQGRDAQRKGQAPRPSANTLTLRDDDEQSDRSRKKSPGRRIGGGGKFKQKSDRDDTPHRRTKRNKPIEINSTNRSVKNKKIQNPRDKPMAERPVGEQKSQRKFGRADRQRDSETVQSRNKPNVRSRTDNNRPVQKSHRPGDPENGGKGVGRRSGKGPGKPYGKKVSKGGRNADRRR